MTREEAITHLKNIRRDMWTEEAEVDAIDMAIEALKGDVPDTNVGDMINRQAAIDSIRKIKANYCETADDQILLIDKAMAMTELMMLPSAQPELIEKTAYIRGFKQGRTQGMIDAQGGKNMIKVEWTNADALQPTCNQLATDCISRKAAIDAMDNIANFVNVEDEDYILQAEAIDNLKALPSAQQWIPVQQNPKRSDWYIVTKRFGNDGELWIGAKWYSTAYGWTGDGVLAWMELPEAYKEGE